MPRYDTRTSQFGLISGTVKSQSDMVLVAEAPGMFAPEARKGHLYVLVETDQETVRARELSQLALRTIRKTFYEDSSFSVTASLRKALVAANNALYQHNFSAPHQRRGTLGVTCAVIKEGDLYVAQVAPALAYILSDNELRMLPSSASFQSSQPLAQLKLNALGASLTVEPSFYRAVLNPGDAALVCVSGFAALLDQNDVLRVLRAGNTDAINDWLAGVAREFGVSDAHALALTIHAPLSAAAQAAPLSRAGVSERGAVAMRRVNDAIARATGEVALMIRGPMERVRRRHTASRLERSQQEQAQLTRMPDEPDALADPLPRPRPLDLGPSLEEQAETERTRRARTASAAPRPSDATQLPPSALLGEVSYVMPEQGERRVDVGDAVVGYAPRLATPHSNLPPLEPTVGERIAQPITRISRYVERANRRRILRRPPPRAVPQARRQQGLSYRREGPSFPWLWLLLLVSLVAVLFLYGINLSSQNQVRQVDNTMTLAEQAVTRIYESPDDATARTRLKEAGDAIAEVQASGVVTSTVDGRQRFEAMQREYERARSAIQRISYFDEIGEVARNPLPGARFDSVIVPPPPRGITETETFGSVYILDADAGILYKQPRAGGPLQALLKSTDSFGPLNVGSIYGVAWRFDTIVAVTHSNEGGPYTYYFLNGNTWNYSILAGSEEWGRGGERFRIANYEGNLYVWGAQASQVLRYLSGQYGEFPLPWILDDGGKQFENALDISVDGKIYLLQPDGHVLVFSSDKGERSFEREIAPQGIEPPLTTVSRFFITGDSESGSIFLVDGYNSRIIQVDKATGEFVQQIKARPDGPVQLDNLLNVFVDTSTSRPMLYLVNGSQILRSALPDQPRPFRETTGTPGATPESQASPTPEPTSSTP